MTLTFKKGFMSSFYAILLMLILLVLGITVIFLRGFVQDLNADMGLALTHNESKEVFSDMDTNYPAFGDGLFLLVFGVFIIGSLVLTYVSDNTPLMLVLDIMILAFLLIVAMGVSNVYDDYISDDNMSTFEADFPITDYLLDNLLLVIGAYAILILIVTFAKGRILL